MTVKMDRFPWDTVLQSIRAKQCTPFIGAGASRGFLPLAAELAADLIAEDERTSGKPCPLSPRDDLSKACQYLAVTRKSGRWPKTKIAEHFARRGTPHMDDPNQIHRVLADLRLPVYITTNYDDFMGLALERNTATVTRGFARWSKRLMTEDSPLDGGYAPSPTHPVVFHLHGTTRVPASMVASEDDYIDFLVNLSKDLANPPSRPGQKAIIPLPIHQALTSNMLLFVGYGLADINFRVILRSLLGALDLSDLVEGITIQYVDNDAPELLQYVEEYFLRTLKVQVFWCSAQEFAMELRSRMG
jgi:hypothetical protein